MEATGREKAAMGRAREAMETSPEAAGTATGAGRLESKPERAAAVRAGLSICSTFP